MYVSTFYSYKGGVGRTMALINVAILLAEAGKRVLIVDFDLEAPGIPSFDMFRSAESRAGVVDYVCSFRDNAKAPDVADFIVKCLPEAGAPIWLMPAGRHTQSGYGEKLNSIDWKDLYDNHEGFLMFEDLRNQWAEHEARFDYVLIDSRTGHTDVGGICTRQLPDSVVVMFLPNEQNIEGLRPIVAAIRDEKIGVRGHKIDLHFCPSNVPELDDEDSILSDMLELAANSLGKPAATIQHYNSMDMLKQPAFVTCRPKSKLTRQYKALMHGIIARNFADEIGAEWALNRMPDRYEAARQEGDQEALFEIEDEAFQIGAYHSENGKICWLLSIVYSRMGAIEDELTALNGAIDHDHQRSRALTRRARLLSSLDRKEPALADLDRLLSSGTASVFELLPAIDLLRAIKPDAWIAPVERVIDKLRYTPVEYSALMRFLMTERDKLSLAVKVGQHALASNYDDNVHGDIRSHLILALIGLGQFERAIDMIGDAKDVIAEARADDLFNLSVALWGRDGQPPVELFEQLLDLIKGGNPGFDTNLHQCVALAEMVTGDAEAASDSIEYARSRARTGERAFSCWRYLEVSGRQMLNDLSAMAQVVDTVPTPQPEFFAEMRRLVN
jgi:MinD-like ATPase involved in chromosome partitioning or flagellar assembly